MRNQREEILLATSEAAGIFNKFPIGPRTSFDIVGALAEMDIPVVFKPLDKLWGATVSVDGELGVLITSKLDFHVQRFTLAHELGHVLLGHDTSFDETVAALGRFEKKSRPVQEIAADTFASELLASRRLILSMANRNHWTKRILSDPVIIYQLALRLGISFQATCWALAEHRFVARSVASNLQAKTVKDLKLSFAPESLITDSWADVWYLTQADSGYFLEAKPNDLFAVQLVDQSSSGYLWELVDPGSHAEVVREQSRELGERYGETLPRTLYLRFNAVGMHRLVFEHRRPWNQQTIANIDISIENWGKETAGFPRRVRHWSLAVNE